jgi:hypothetical protein
MSVLVLRVLHLWVLTAIPLLLKPDKSRKGDDILLSDLSNNITYLPEGACVLLVLEELLYPMVPWCWSLPLEERHWRETNHPD